MAESTLEQRMTALEEAVRNLQDAVNTRKPANDWLDRVIGSMKGEPAFDEVRAHGRAIRDYDKALEELDALPPPASSLPADFSRADIYDEHD